ncbi:hypothetical protein [Nocardioides litoris]|uniref:hypothetical protein n=1 Tax=Nocardioides litoris TaxID=1926648 RepID=UPI0011212274|nr:hypothetical protein [Nocardioides litoris]
MSDLPDPLDEPDLPAERPEPTGVPRVDAVLDAVAAAADAPPAEQVVVLEQAHAELRRALDDPGTA